MNYHKDKDNPLYWHKFYWQVLGDFTKFYNSNKEKKCKATDWHDKFKEAFKLKINKKTGERTTQLFNAREFESYFRNVCAVLDKQYCFNWFLFNKDNF